MRDVETEHLILHAADLGEIGRIRRRTPATGDRWADDYPFAGDVVATTALQASRAAGEDPRPFGYYRIDRRADQRALGGIGFKGHPVDGVVDVGCGLVPSARGRRYAAEALLAFTVLAAPLGVRRLCADVEHGNIPSVRTLERVGFSVLAVGDTETRYALDLV